MTKNTPSLSINLAKKKSNTTTDAVLHWAVTVGRFLVIFTETIALAAFLYRFVLDRQVVDLNDRIKGKQTLLSSLSNQEKTYRSLQNKIAFIKEKDIYSQKYPALFEEVISVGQGKVTFDDLTISEGQLRLEIATPAVSALNSFVTDLRNVDAVVDVSIDRIENRTSAATIVVAISAELTEEFSGKENIETQPGQRPVISQ